VSGVPTGQLVAIETVQGRNEPRVGYLLAYGPVESSGGNSGSVTLGPTPRATNGNVTDSAQLTQSNGALSVRVQALDMHPGSAYATSLNLGSCQWLSYVLYDLPQMNADANGNGSISITINNAEPISASNNCTSPSTTARRSTAATSCQFPAAMWPSWPQAEVCDTMACVTAHRDLSLI
jgi:hypothetical protein